MAETVDTAAIQKTLRETAPKPTPLWQRPLFSAAVIGVCLTVMALVSNVALYRWGSSEADKVEELSAQVSVNTAQQECRSAIAADDAIAQSNKNVTADRVNEIAAAAVLARDESLPETERAAWRAATTADRVRAVFLADVEASRVRFEQATRRSQINELCAAGEVPEPQVQPIPVEPIVVLPPN